MATFTDCEVGCGSYSYEFWFLGPLHKPYHVPMWRITDCEGPRGPHLV